MNANEPGILERWLPVVDYEGLYEVSNFGRVRSAPRKGTRGGILRPQVRRDGYLGVSLYRDGKHASCRIHVLVAEAFIGLRPDGKEVRHLNGNRVDNRAENLAWGSASDNAYDQVRHGTHNEASKTHCPQGHPYNLINTYWRPDGSRDCRACVRERHARYRARKAAAKANARRAVAA